MGWLGKAKDSGFQAGRQAGSEPGLPPAKRPQEVYSRLPLLKEEIEVSPKRGGPLRTACLPAKPNRGAPPDLLPELLFYLFIIIVIVIFVPLLFFLDRARAVPAALGSARGGGSARRGGTQGSADFFFFFFFGVKGGTGWTKVPEALREPASKKRGARRSGDPRAVPIGVISSGPRRSVPPQNQGPARGAAPGSAAPLERSLGARGSRGRKTPCFLWGPHRGSCTRIIPGTLTPRPGAAAALLRTPSPTPAVAASRNSA